MKELAKTLSCDTYTFIPLAKTWSHALTGMEAGKCSLFPGWPLHGRGEDEILKANQQFLVRYSVCSYDLSVSSVPMETKPIMMDM